MPDHTWDYCDFCCKPMVRCGTCGNNCCNGGRGEVFSPDPDVMVPCPDCDSAYDKQNAETAPQELIDRMKADEDFYEIRN